MKRTLIVVTLVAALALGASAFAQGGLGWLGNIMGPGGWGGFGMGSAGMGSGGMGSGGMGSGGMGSGGMGSGGMGSGGWGGFGMGSGGMGGHMSGSGMMGSGGWGSEGWGSTDGYTNEDRGFLDETVDLRREYNQKLFDYEEALRQDNENEAKSIARELEELSAKINEKAARGGSNQRSGYGQRQGSW